MFSNYIKPYPLGAYEEDGAIRFSFISKKSDCGVLIYDKKSRKRLYKLPFTDKERVGNIHCKCFRELPADQISYQFYEENRIVPDPNARMFDQKYPYGKERKLQDLKAIIPKTEFDWQDDVRPRIPYEDCVCYCAHVRGFTRHASSGVTHRGTFAGLAEKLDYLKQTGITTVELQPIYEFTEIPTEEERRAELGMHDASHMPGAADLDRLVPKKINYWGYKQGYYYAPKASYAAGDDACREFKEMVHAFHQRGMEVVLQLYFPKGFTAPEIIYVLRYWVLEYRVDGFHLMGPDIAADVIASEPMLAETKLWYYYFDTDRLYGRDEMPEYRNLAAYSDEYIYSMRKYLKGDENMLETVLTQMRKIPPKMGRIHYMSNYFGLTLKDMVCYERKHNEANGEDNRDGNDFNGSWNCGEEGPSKRKKVQALRNKQIRNAMTMLMMSQSTPLIFMGDEFGNSQRGNNNPYCQDNNVTWLDWNDLKKNESIYAFWKKMVELRREHAVLRPAKENRIMDYLSCGYPDLSYHGENAWRPRMESYNRHIGIMYCGKYAKNTKGEEDTFLYFALNMYWEKRNLAMPKLPAGMKWKLVLSTEEMPPATGIEELPGGTASADHEKTTDEIKESKIQVPPRSCMIYVGVPVAPDKKKRKKRDPGVQNA